MRDRLTSTQGIRISHHSRAGTFETYRFDGSYLLVTGTKVRGLIASGFKAPSLFQLFAVSDPYFGGGNP
ncbi:MAG: TonB-dependent receptor, partial [Candidatus Omnitrophica bacterium]|nr:TonB-dependent receptor [Candidatus Omnitrophota bacterium]